MKEKCMEISDMAGIVLAGGFSSRMGRDKAKLTFQGKTFLEIQIEKMKNIGITEIIVSGYEDCPDDVICVRDVIAHKGPMSGIHAGLKAMSKPCALVVAIDIPLIPEQVLEQLIHAHEPGLISVTVVDGKPEPLIGIYDKSLADACEEVLQSEKPAVYRLLNKMGYRGIEYNGDLRAIMNCNTVKEYDVLTSCGHIYEYVNVNGGSEIGKDF